MARQTLSIIGLGLIGGSIGLAARRLLSHYSVIGYDQSADAMRRAAEIGAVDSIQPSAEDAIRVADGVIVCVPPSAVESIFRILADQARPGTVVTDVTSTKRSIMRLAETVLPRHVEFVGSHPVAGSEKTGLAGADAALFENALCVVTPGAASRPEAVQAVHDLWKALGLRTVELSADEHDRHFAAVSHLPHALAAALMNQTPAASARFAGKGFADTTRIAAGNPYLWRDILLDNADHVREKLLTLSGELRNLADLLTISRRDELHAFLERASDARRAIGDRSAESAK